MITLGHNVYNVSRDLFSMINSPHPKYQYAKEKVFEEVGITLTDLLSDEGINTERFRPDIFPKRAGERSLTYQLTDNEGRGYGRVEVSPYVSCNLVSELESVAEVVSSLYSAEAVAQKSEAYVKEYEKLSDELQTRLSNLPYGTWAETIPEFLGYKKVILSAGGGDLFEFYRALSLEDKDEQERRITISASRAGMTRKKVENLMKKIEDYLGPEIIGLLNKLY